MDWTPFILLGFGMPGFLLAGFLEGDLWLGIRPAFVFVFAVLGFVVGSIIGDRQGRTWQGAFLGVTLGVVGWVLVSLLPVLPDTETPLATRRDS